MIIESIGTWLFSVFTYAVQLLPKNGDMFNSIPKLDTTIFKSLSMVNGYVPIQQIGYMLVILIAMQIALYAYSLGLGIFNYLTKLIP